MADTPEPGSEMSVTVRGYEVTVRAATDGTLHVTCPKLPQVNVRDQTLPSALAHAYASANQIAPDGSAPERVAYADVILTERLTAAVERLNPRIPAEARSEAKSSFSSPKRRRWSRKTGASTGC
jgi:hypothetical protein